ncbi:MAG: hypothetical protein OEV23_09580, partial [Gallionella sp.]|nr:hypothetical protein [Gallionella sp.]
MGSPLLKLPSPGADIKSNSNLRVGAAKKTGNRFAQASRYINRNGLCFPAFDHPVDDRREDDFHRVAHLATG